MINFKRKILALILATFLISACGMQIEKAQIPAIESYSITAETHTPSQKNSAVINANKQDLLTEIQRLEARLLDIESEHEMAAEIYNETLELSREYAASVERIRAHRIAFSESSMQLSATKAALHRVTLAYDSVLASR